MNHYYPAAIAAGLFFLTLSLLLPEPAATVTMQILAAVAFALAVIFATIL